MPTIPPKPLGPSEGGGPPAQNMLNWNDMTRGPGGSSTLPQTQNPNVGPAPQPYQAPPQAPQPYDNNGNGAYAVPNKQPTSQPPRR